MKRSIRLLALAVISLLAGNDLYGQCVPDTEGCIDVDEPGQMCPLKLPDATVNADYTQVITIIPPDVAEIPPAPPIDIAFITIDTVAKIPEGMTYEANADTLFAGEAYCILISGKPKKAGVDTLSITVTPYIYYGIPPVPIPTFPITNDTSIIVTVLEASGLDPNKFHKFQVLPNIPNPFSEVTRIGFFTPFDDQVELNIYNILGELIHEESQGFSPGEHYFEYDGHALQPGTYIYRVTNHDQFFTGKIVKARM